MTAFATENEGAVETNLSDYDTLKRRNKTNLSSVPIHQVYSLDWNITAPSSRWNHFGKDLCSGGSGLIHV